MKFYFLLPSTIICTLLLDAQTYDKVLPDSINTGGTINVTADCQYAPNTGGTTKEDCYVGYKDGGGFQNFSHSGGESLAIRANLPTGKTKDIVLTLTDLSVDGESGLFLREFHGVTASKVNIDNGSLLVAELIDQKATSQYGSTPVLVFRDDPYNQSLSRIDNRSGLRVQNGDILLGKTRLYIGHFSSLEAAKGTSGSQLGGTIKNQTHITNYGYIIADTLKNGESITVSGGGAPPGIGNQNINGVIDNYGLIDAKNVDNAAQGTINFHSFNGEMGAITGTLTNTNGTLNIYVAGAKYKKHLLAGNGSTGLDKANIIFDNNASEFITANLDNSKTDIIIQRKEDSVSAFQRTFNGSERGILNALDSKYNIYTYGGSDFLKKVVNDTHKGVYSSYLSAPLTMLESMKPKFNTSNTNLDVNLIGNGFLGSDVGLGGLGGLNVNYGIAIGRYTTQYQLGYGYGTISNERKNYDTNIRGHIVSFGAINQFKLSDKLESETTLYSLIGLFDSLQTLKMASLNTTSSLSKSSFNIFNLGVDTRLGYQINFGNLSMKPFAGFNQALSIRNKFTEKGGFNAVVPGTNSYMMYLSTGLENKYSFSNKKYVYAKLGYEYRMINTKNLAINLDGINVVFTTPFNNKFVIDMGGEILFRSTSLIALGISYNTAITQDIHYFGGNLTYKFKF